MTLSTPDVAHVGKEDVKKGTDVADDGAIRHEITIGLSNVLETENNGLKLPDRPYEQTLDFGKITSGESHEEVGEKNSSFALVQAKFEELCSSNSQKLVNTSSQEVSNQVKVKPAHMAASDCGTEISISSTLDSPDRSETEGAGEIILEIQNLGRRDARESDILSLKDSCKTEELVKTEIQESGTGHTDQHSVNSKSNKRGRNPSTKKQSPPIPGIINNNNYSGKRRESLDNGVSENGQSIELQYGGGKSLPSYMQATESARAKVYASNSPKSSPDLHRDVNGKKRQSFPLVNGKLDSSPRVLRSSPSSSAGNFSFIVKILLLS